MAIGQTLQKIVKILDGQPTGRKGQSLVEMALTTPILILMILGLAEVGFLANNYLILMDAVRAGSRDAASLDPVSWRYGDARNTERLDCDTETNWAAMTLGTQNTTQYGVRWVGPQVPPIQVPPIIPVQPRGYYTLGAGAPVNLNYARDSSTIPPSDKAFGFFDEVTCQVLNAMQPLVYNDTDATAPPIPSQDDVVVSAISYSIIDYSTMAAGSRTPAYATGPGLNSDKWVTVTGRWPMENRFCAVSNAGGTWIAGDERDPFDYKNPKFNTAAGTNGSTVLPPALLAGKTSDANEGIPFDASSGWSAGSYGNGVDSLNSYVLTVSQARDLTDALGRGDNQGVRGFVFSGHHKNTAGAGTPAADKCFGSFFRVQDIEQKLNLNDTVVNPKVPNGGLVIVEIFWQHHPLFFGPLFQGFNGNKANDPMLHVWGWFPVPAGEATPTP